MQLTLAEADRIIQSAIAKAVSMGVRVSVAVVDEGAHLVALRRMDGAMPLSPAIAEGKAIGAAMFQRDGAALLAMANDRPAFFNSVSGMARGAIVPGAGSVPIKRGDAFIGAVGVSGAKPEQDLECAEAGVSSLG
jgi:uncharacterized protein GlcG (DUF336 family)